MLKTTQFHYPGKLFTTTDRKMLHNIEQACCNNESSRMMDVLRNARDIVPTGICRPGGGPGEVEDEIQLKKEWYFDLCIFEAGPAFL
jgi:hypothetical protein